MFVADLNKHGYFCLIIGVTEIPTASDEFTVFASHKLDRTCRMTETETARAMAMVMGQFLKKSDGIVARSHARTTLEDYKGRSVICACASINVDLLRHLSYRGLVFPLELGGTFGLSPVSNPIGSHSASAVRRAKQ